MNGGGRSGHGKVDRRNPHVTLTDGLADVGQSVCDTVVTSGDVLAVHLVILEIHVSPACGFISTRNDGVRHHIVTNFTGWTGWHNLIGGGCEDLVDHMDNTVACHDISRGNGRITSHDRSVGHGKGQVVAVERGDGQPVGHVGRIDGPFNDVIEEDISQRLVGFVVVKRCQVNARRRKRSVGWSKHRERTVGLEGAHKSDMAEGCNQRSMVARVGGVGRNIFACVG